MSNVIRVAAHSISHIYHKEKQILNTAKHYRFYFNFPILVFTWFVSKQI